MTAFSPRIVLITGGGSGIGAALARKLVKEGARVVIADLNMQGMRALTDELGSACEPVEIDVAVWEPMRALAERISINYGSLDLIVNCAGISSYGEMLDIPLEQWRNVMDVNLWGTIHGSLAAYAVMRKQGAGFIVNMGSMSTFLQPPLFGSYLTSKAGVLSFSLALAIEAEVYGVQVSVVCPGNVRTPLLGSWRTSSFTPTISAEDAASRILKAVSKRRRIIVFPFYAKIFWWLDRLCPNILNPLRRLIIGRARQRRHSTSGKE
jgi:NAD(P)-dependent dehydrogenase (short-subunit alcohol dehydrogenase family)